MVFSLLAAIVLLIISFGIISYFVKLILASLVGDLRGFRGRMRLRQKQSALRRLDEHLKENRLDAARDLISTTLYLDSSATAPAVVEGVATHHLEVLSRVVALSDRMGRRLAALPLFEDLLQTRAELLRAKSEIVQTKRGLRARRLSGGQRTPDWAINEFSKKLLEINDRLGTNRQTIEAKLRELVSPLHESESDDNVTYH